MDIMARNYGVFALMGLGLIAMIGFATTIAEPSLIASGYCDNLVIGSFRSVILNSINVVNGHLG